MALEWPQHFSHFKSMGIFRDAQGQLTRHLRSNLAELILDVMIVLVTYKNEEDPIKNEVARVATTFSPL